MSEPKLISPMLDKFAIGNAISSHDGVCCYPAMREDSDDKYILKVISVPASQVQVDALILSGAYSDPAAAQNYFRELVTDIENEADVLSHLSKLEGFCGYEDFQVVPKEDGVGFDVYLLSRYRRSLAKHFRRSPMTHLGAVNLGIDLCSAMSLCRHAGCMYVDIRPDNIFITEDGKYCVGDLGFIPLSSLKYASLPDKYRSSWTAPEIEDAYSSLNTVLDIYAIGLVLYQAYNNGVLPSEGSAPGEVFPAPAYADYEMADIILKACAPDPRDRWQTPKEFGQALISYMQRNSVNDEPITPPSVSVLEPEEKTEEAAPEQVPEKVPASEEPAPETPDELAFISSLVSDETAPTEENTADLESAALTDELSEMLSQADDLLAHELPEPVVVPDYVEVPVPEPPAPQEPEEEAEEAEAAATPDTEAEPAFEAAEDERFDLSEYMGQQADAPAEVPEPEPEPDPVPPEKTSRPGKTAAVVLIVMAILAALSTGAYFFYTGYYLQHIDTLILDGQGDTLTVEIGTEIDNSLLHVICTDTYGGTRTADVRDSTARFEDLKPGSQYSVMVSVDGFHSLTGNFSASYATPPETSIVAFSAIAGAEDGSAILSITANGPEPETWNATYSAPDEEAKTVSFTGHTATVTGLTVGKDYTFRILPGDDLFLTGSQELTFTASKIVVAQNLAITEADEHRLTVSWSAPEGSAVTSWNVRCYNDNGYDKTITTSDLTASFEDVDTTCANTVEVTAAGMTQSVRTFLTANPVSITKVTGSITEPGKLVFDWTFSGKAPQGGWLLVYTAEDSTEEKVIKCSENRAVVAPVIPESRYRFTIQAADGSTVLNGVFTSETPATEMFSGYGVSADDMELSMCRTPDLESWSKDDLTEDSYTTTFTQGEKASFLVRLNTEYDVEYDDIMILYVIRDGGGKLISSESQSRRWIDMWRRGYCELNIPLLPEAPGGYTLDLYFNGCTVSSQVFTIAS